MHAVQTCFKEMQTFATNTPIYYLFPHLQAAGHSAVDDDAGLRRRHQLLCAVLPARVPAHSIGGAVVARWACWKSCVCRSLPKYRSYSSPARPTLRENANSSLTFSHFHLFTFHNNFCFHFSPGGEASLACLRLIEPVLKHPFKLVREKIAKCISAVFRCFVSVWSDTLSICVCMKSGLVQGFASYVSTAFVCSLIVYSFIYFSGHRE